MIKLWRDPFSPFGVQELDRSDLLDESCLADDIYTKEVLSGIAESGFNGIWLHGLLHHLVSTEEFPEFGVNGKTHIEKLTRLIERANPFGIRVFLYLQVPRAIPVADEAFWRNHADVGGQQELLAHEEKDGSYPVRAICTSTPQVKRYLKNAAATLARALPRLGGVVLITASEYPAHCYSRRGRLLNGMGVLEKSRIECPRCSQRSPADVIAEVVTLIRDGIKSVDRDMAVIAWNWSWTMYYDPPCAEIIRKLPKDVILMADFERGAYRDYPGREPVWVDEYSIGFPGPGELFRHVKAVAEECSLPLMAKLQFGTTHELATVANLPALGNLFEKASFLKRNHLAGFMGCWNFGNMLSANSAAFNFFLKSDAPAEKTAALEAFADYFLPGCDAKSAAEAWLDFGRALVFYPFSIPYLYRGPTNYALSFLSRPGPLNSRNAGRSWLPDERGDDLSNALDGPFSLEAIIPALERVAAIWREGTAKLTEALRMADSRRAREELSNAEVAGCCFQSAANLFRFYRLRLNWTEACRQEYRKIAAEELANVEHALAFVERDRRMGFHSEAHCHMFDGATLRRKICELQAQLRETC